MSEACNPYVPPRTELNDGAEPDLAEALRKQLRRACLLAPLTVVPAAIPISLYWGGASLNVGSVFFGVFLSTVYGVPIAYVATFSYGLMVHLLFRRIKYKHPVAFALAGACPFIALVAFGAAPGVEVLLSGAWFAGCVAATFGHLLHQQG